MSRTIGWFSCGAASAIAVKLTNPDIIAYCETGSEHPDNERFARDIEKWLGRKITRLKSKKYADTWEVWEDRRYISGIAGAPCTGELKIKPREAFQRPDDIHIFGYTEDPRDGARAKALREHWPDMTCEFPLIKHGLTKAATIAMLYRAGIEPPLTYALGFPNVNCLPCCKATSPAYWALVRKHFPEKFERMVKLSRKFGARLTRIEDVRLFIDEIPADYPTVDPIAPDCDMLCHLAEQEFDNT